MRHPATYVHLSRCDKYSSRKSLHYLSCCNDSKSPTVSVMKHTSRGGKHKKGGAEVLR